MEASLSRSGIGFYSSIQGLTAFEWNQVLKLKELVSLSPLNVPANQLLILNELLSLSSLMALLR